MTTHLVYLLGGAALLLAVVLPYALRTAALSPPVVLLGLGALIGLLPGTGDSAFSPSRIAGSSSISRSSRCSSPSWAWGWHWIAP